MRGTGGQVAGGHIVAQMDSGFDFFLPLLGWCLETPG